MDIYSPQGTKVKYLDENGNESDKESARNYFKKGAILTVEHCNVHNWVTFVKFKEHKGVYFNSVMFEDLL